MKIRMNNITLTKSGTFPNFDSIVDTKRTSPIITKKSIIATLTAPNVAFPENQTAED